MKEYKIPKSQKFTHLVADLEATTSRPTVAWKIGFMDIFSEDDNDYFSTDNIDIFFRRLFNYRCANVYFHNQENYDGRFIFDYLLKHGFVHINNREYRANRKSVIVGDFQKFTVYHGGNAYNFLDSMKLLTGSIGNYGDVISEEYGIEISKGGKHKHDTPHYKTLEEVNNRSVEQVSKDDEYFFYDLLIMKYMFTLRTIKINEGYKVEAYKVFESGYYTISSISSKVMHGKVKTWKEGRKWKPVMTYRVPKCLPYQEVIGWETKEDGKYKPIIQEDDEKFEEYLKGLAELSWKYPSRYADRMLKFTTEKLVSMIEKSKGTDKEINPKVIEFHKKYVQKKKEKNEQRNYQVAVNTIAKNAYQGGFTAANPMHQNQLIECKADGVYKNGKLFLEKEHQQIITVDGNALYPSQMLLKDLPGNLIDHKTYPKFRGTGNKEDFENKQKQAKETLKELLNDDSKLIIAAFHEVSGNCKPESLPIIKPRTDDKNNKEQSRLYNAKINLKNFSMTEPIFKYFLENYTDKEFSVSHILVFDLFDKKEMKKFLDMIGETKEKSIGLSRFIAKLMMNSSYGYEGYFDKEVPVYTYQIENGRVVKKKVGEQRIGNDFANVQIAAFITAYGRVELGGYVNEIGVDKFLYADTDSIHMIGTLEEVEKVVPTHDTHFGYWKIESIAKSGKYIQAKTYAEKNSAIYKGGIWRKFEESEWQFTVAGYNGDAMSIERFGFGIPNLVKRTVSATGGTLIIPQIQVIGGIGGMLNTMYDDVLVKMNDELANGTVSDEDQEKMIVELEEIIEDFNEKIVFENSQDLPEFRVAVWNDKSQ